MRDLHIYAPLIYLIYLMKPEGQKVSHNLSGSQWISVDLSGSTSKQVAFLDWDEAACGDFGAGSVLQAS